MTWTPTRTATGSIARSRTSRRCRRRWRRRSAKSTEAKLVWRPQSRTEVDLDTATKLMKLIDLLEEDDDVQAVTHNFDVPEEIAAQLLIPAFGPAAPFAAVRAGFRFAGGG